MYQRDARALDRQAGSVAALPPRTCWYRPRSYSDALTAGRLAEGRCAPESELLCMPRSDCAAQAATCTQCCAAFMRATPTPPGYQSLLSGRDIGRAVAGARSCGTHGRQSHRTSVDAPFTSFVCSKRAEDGGCCIQMQLHVNPGGHKPYIISDACSIRMAL